MLFRTFGESNAKVIAPSQFYCVSISSGFRLAVSSVIALATGCGDSLCRVQKPAPPEFNVARTHCTKLSIVWIGRVHWP